MLIPAFLLFWFKWYLFSILFMFLSPMLGLMFTACYYHYKKAIFKAKPAKPASSQKGQSEIR
jgi:hypothetical protein